MNIGVPLIVIVVFLVIWVVTNVIRAQQEDAKGYKRNVSQPQRPSATGKIEQNSGNDIERFLAEIDRLRKKPGGADNPIARPGDPAARPGAAAIAASKVQPKPKQPKAKKPPSRRVEPTAPTSPPSRTTAGSVASRTFDVPPPPTPTEATPVTGPTNVEAPRRINAPAKPSAAISAAATPVQLGVSDAILTKKTAREIASPALQSLEDLLKSSRGPAIAVIMQEILGKPKSLKKE